MQNYQSITTDFSVAAALSSGDLAQIHAMGFSTVINNLPDEEVLNGFTSEVARAEAEALGLGYVHLPVSGVTISDQNIIDQFAKILSTSDQPVFSHCKTGTRSAILWGLASAQKTRPGQILSKLEDAGFEFDYLDDEFEEQWEFALEKSGVAIPAHAAIRPEISNCL
jgi:uncharacterized protein (TIGR01244 family)